jgi:transcriptional regulator with XRE-family HTH domain
MNDMAKPQSSPFDRFVGERVREARLANRLSQKELGDLLGVSFQQIQKYESGVNRVAGARLERMVTALNRPLHYFFPNASDARSRADPLMSQFISSKEGLELARKWLRMPQAARRIILDMIDHISKSSAQESQTR